VSQPIPISFTRRAAAQTEAAGRWWRENRTKAPEALREELEQALQLVASQPEIGAMARSTGLAGVRRVLLSRVRYHLYYRVLEAPTRSIEVLALWHVSRGDKPGA
jgi:plasmid stabilization system protein ParE